MINAIIQNKNGETAVLDLTAHYHEIYKDLQAIGYYGSPERILLRDEEDEEYRVKLYSDSDIGNSMIRLLNENDTDTLRIECEISRDDSSEYFDYEPTANETHLIKDMIAEKIREEYHQTPQEFCEEFYDTDDIRGEHTLQENEPSYTMGGIL